MLRRGAPAWLRPRARSQGCNLCRTAATTACYSEGVAWYERCTGANDTTVGPIRQAARAAASCRCCCCMQDAKARAEQPSSLAASERERAAQRARAPASSADDGGMPPTPAAATPRSPQSARSDEALPARARFGRGFGGPSLRHLPSDSISRGRLLIAACERKESVEAVQALLIDGGAALGVTDAKSRTALFWCALLGAAETARALLFAGADPTQPDDNGWLPEQVVSSSRKPRRCLPRLLTRSARRLRARSATETACVSSTARSLTGS